MSVLCDATIRTRLFYNSLVIDPLPEDHAIQPASVDLRLGDEFKWENGESAIDPYTVNKGGGVYLEPGEFLLGTTEEWIEIPDDLVARVEGKSSLGRRGILVHITAGFIDPGFKGQITLEFYNVSQEKFLLRPGMFICQLSLMALDGPAERPYGHPGLKSHYQGQKGTTAGWLR